jgi:hypothetical protein
MTVLTYLMLCPLPVTSSGDKAQRVMVYRFGAKNLL